MFDAVVTGAAGFIGQALCAALSARGWNILPLTRAKGDVAELDTWQSLPPARVLFHLAGRSFVPDSWAQTPAFVRANVLGTEHALWYCRQHRTRLVLASAYVYGIPLRLPVRESDPVKPNNPYALTKRLAEQLCEFAARHQGIEATVLRIFNVYGPGQRADFLIPKIIRQVRTQKEIQVFDLTPKRDYVYLTDVVEAFVKAGELGDGFHIINVGSGCSLSVLEIVDKIQKAAGTDLPIVSQSEERRQEIPEVVADITLAKQLLGWQPQTSFEHGIEQLLRNN